MVAPLSSGGFDLPIADLRLTTLLSVGRTGSGHDWTGEWEGEMGDRSEKLGGDSGVRQTR